MTQRDTVPEEVMDRELWLLHVNALEDALLGPNPENHSFVGQTDFDFVNDGTLPAGGEYRLEVRAPGGDSINGQVVSTGQYTLDVEWLDDNAGVVRNEGIISNREPGVWVNYELDAKSPFVNIVIINDTSSDQTINGMVHYK